MASRKRLPITQDHQRNTYPAESKAPEMAAATLAVLDELASDERLRRMFARAFPAGIPAHVLDETYPAPSTEDTTTG